MSQKAFPLMFMCFQIFAKLVENKNFSDLSKDLSVLNPNHNFVTALVPAAAASPVAVAFRHHYLFVQSCIVRKISY